MLRTTHSLRKKKADNAGNGNYVVRSLLRRHSFNSSRNLSNSSPLRDEPKGCLHRRLCGYVRNDEILKSKEGSKEGNVSRRFVHKIVITKSLPGRGSNNMIFYRFPITEENEGLFGFIVWFNHLKIFGGISKSLMDACYWPSHSILNLSNYREAIINYIHWEIEKQSNECISGQVSVMTKIQFALRVWINVSSWYQ